VPISEPKVTRARGGCLCGAVRYEVRGPLRDVVVCHCEECRRWHGHACAYTAAERGALVLGASEALRWVESPRSDARARRGFCVRCGSSLFWDAPEEATISIAAGTLDRPTSLRTVAHVYIDGAGDYYELPEDGLPRYERSSGSAWPSA
jgi:hypothetical protein